MAGSAIASDFEHEAFWVSFLRFLCRHPMIDPAQIGPLVDFIRHQKYVHTEEIRRDGSVAVVPPPHPGFSMDRRSPDALLRQMQAWHDRLGREASHGPELWAGCGVRPLRWETGRERERVWAIEEIRTRKALQQEGRAMRHCVASYLQSCAAGHVSVA